MTLAERLLDVLRRPFRIAGTDIETSASIGITFSSLGYVTPSDMLRDADAAMYKAKVNGRARYAIFDTLLQAEVCASRAARARPAQRAGGRRAVAGVSADLRSRIAPDHGLRGAGALEPPRARRDQPAHLHRHRGGGGPDHSAHRFHVAQRLPPAARMAAARRFAQPSSSIHVNVSGSDIAHRGLLGRVSAAIEEAQLQPRHLTLELTENILIERLEAALPTLNALRALGVGLSLDDFGTGYSSLRHLSALPVSSLKIDRRFVRGAAARLQRSRRAARDRLAGGVARQVDHRRGHRVGGADGAAAAAGLPRGQGYHLARPLPPG